MADIVPPLLSDTPPPPPNCEIDDSDDEFGDFAATDRFHYEDSPSPPGTPLQLPTEPPPQVEVNLGKPKDEANLEQPKDFCDKRKAANASEIADCDDTTFDDFGDFAKPVAPESDDFQSFTVSKLLAANDENVLAKAAAIVREMFPQTTANFADFCNTSESAGDKIFDRIKSVTETHALSFQWPKSASQSLLLKSLNIDSRNILHGGWNQATPKFASNLSLAPLEPVKSEPPSEVSCRSDPDTLSHATESWEAWLDALPICSKEAKKQPKTVVLRETHISGEIVSWLEPTIVTPELTRKPYLDYEDPKPAEDDFGDFAYSLPQPLKPSPVKPPEVASSIGWPDAGITDDEIGRLEALGLARHKPESPARRAPRCSTPDLPLSVLNLQADVPRKLTMASAQVAPKPRTRLNLISNQYADRALGEFDQYASAKAEEDEWSDFVSAPLPDLDFVGRNCGAKK